jgi:hypothetical protein
MPLSTTRKLLTIVEASGMLSPHLEPTNATNWLADMRRTVRHYPDRGANPPECVKFNRVWHYPIEGIEKAIDELIAFKRRPVTP